MPALRLVKEGEPFEARENVALRQMLARLTPGTHERGGTFVLLLREAQALYEVLAHRTFSPTQLEEIERLIREVNPQRADSEWNSRRLRSFVRTRRHALGRHEWIDQPISRLHAAMSEQWKLVTFRLCLTRAALVIFITTSAPRTDRLAG